MNFIQFMSAKTGSDSARVYAHGHTGQITEVMNSIKTILSHFEIISFLKWPLPCNSWQ